MTLALYDYFCFTSCIYHGKVFGTNTGFHIQVSLLLSDGQKGPLQS